MSDLNGTLILFHFSFQSILRSSNPMDHTVMLHTPDLLPITDPSTACRTTSTKYRVQYLTFGTTTMMQVYWMLKFQMKLIYDFCLQLDSSFLIKGDKDCTKKYFLDRNIFLNFVFVSTNLYLFDEFYPFRTLSFVRSPAMSCAKFLQKIASNLVHKNLSFLLRSHNFWREFQNQFKVWTKFWLILSLKFPYCFIFKCEWHLKKHICLNVHPCT